MEVGTSTVKKSIHTITATIIRQFKLCFMSAANLGWWMICWRAFILLRLLKQCILVFELGFIHQLSMT